MTSKAVLLGAALLIAMGAVRQVDGAIIRVPDNEDTIALAIQVAESGDEILVTRNHTETGGLIVDKQLTIDKEPGATVVVSAGSTDAKALSVLADGCYIEGITFNGGPSVDSIVEVYGQSELHDCVIQDNGYEFTVGAVTLFEGATLSGCTIELPSGRGRAVRICESNATHPARVVDNTMEITLDDPGNYFQGTWVDDGTITVATDAVVSGNTFNFSGPDAVYGVGVWLNEGATDCDIENNDFIGAGDGILALAEGSTIIKSNVIENCVRGLRLLGGPGYEVTNNTIVYDACTGGTDGIRIEDVFSRDVSEFSNNLVVNTGFGINFFSYNDPSGSWTILHNAYWTDSENCGTGSNKTLSQDALREDLEPRFCAAHESPVGEYTQRIDSGVASGNNPWGELVGALDVECAWGSLAQDATVAANAVVRVLEDVTVRSGQSLTIGEGVILDFDDDDGNPGGGNDASLNELIVEGTLNVAGGSTNKVKLRPAGSNPSEGEWKGVFVDGGGVGKIDNAEITYAVEGILGDEQADTVSVTHCTFAGNQLKDIEVAGDNSAVVTISDNEITVGDGTGIDFSANYGVVSDNVITCDSVTDRGVYYEAVSYDQVLSGNTITGCTNGSGVYVGGARNKQPHIRSNTINTSKYGINVTISEANIGYQDRTDLTNTITSNTVGILVDGSDADPMIRSNDITSNAVGIQIRNSANPDIGDSSDTGSSLGKNKLSGNTTYCLWNRNTSGTVQAEGNYLGGCDPYPPSCWEGDFYVTYSLCTAPFAVFMEKVLVSDKSRGLTLRGTSPNPIRGTAIIDLALGEGPRPVGVSIFDLQGRLVRDFGDVAVGPGTYRLFWDGRDAAGGRVGTGIYFIRAWTKGEAPEIAKVLVMR